MNLRPRLLGMLTPVLALALLAACQNTRFASAPAGADTACDPAWVGTWQIDQAREDGSYEDIGLLEVPAGCTPMQARGTNGKTEDLDQDYHFGFTAVDAMRLLVATPRHGEKPGVLLFRYDATPRRIEVYMVDHRHVAQRILDGSLPGDSALENRVREGEHAAGVDSIDNYVVGDPAAIAALLRGDPALYATSPWLVLRRQPSHGRDP